MREINKPKKAYGLVCDGVLVLPSIHSLKRDTDYYIQKALPRLNRNRYLYQPVKELERHKCYLAKLEISVKRWKFGDTDSRSLGS